MRDLQEIQGNNATMVLISADRPNLGTEELRERHANMKATITGLLGLKATDVVGCFEGETEAAMAVMTNDRADVRRLAMLASEYDQASILVLGAQGETLRDGRIARELVIADFDAGTDTHGEIAGMFRPVDQETAHRNVGWTYVPAMRQYFTITS